MNNPYHRPFVYGNILTKEKILLLGDDPVTARGLNRVAKKQHFILYYVKECRNIKKVEELNPKLIILDFSPSHATNSLNICKQLKKTRHLKHIPVIILNKGLTRSRDIVRALETGAEDCLIKPLGTNLLLAKIKAILRRMRYQEEPEEILKYKNLITLNLTTHTVWVKNRQTKLTPKEFALLYFLMKRKGKILKRKFLMEHIWEQKYFGDTRTVNKHIETLRKKLGPASKCIQTIERVGYRFMKTGGRP
jgi:two-component system alkaline phosphatase synthesis response regulator PhoP